MQNRKKIKSNENVDLNEITWIKNKCNKEILQVVGKKKVLLSIRYFFIWYNQSLLY